MSMAGHTLTETRTAYGAQPNLLDQRLRKRATRLVWFTVALVLAASFAFPLYFMVSSSFKAETEVLANPVHWFPLEFQGLTQYQKGFDAVPLVRYFFNSTLMATIDVI